MGGPCRLKVPGKLGSRAPPCTDNFQLVKFMFDGKEWHSVEQCYQAYKFAEVSIQDKLRKTLPYADEKASGHGMRVWSQGQRYANVRKDWDAVKVEVMYLANRAKYAQNPDFQEELLSTGCVEIDGAPSTSWTTKTGQSVNWSLFNGLIQSRLREELRPVEEQDTALIESITNRFRDYCEGEGGVQLPLPGHEDELIFPSQASPSGGG
uniref:NADAR domain-containing protein n=1 Tax=Noctiluca scintillans TaxID=2966 RepID=A0A7S1F550_NOCSC|mmetsp:Transcript_35038/g.93453  ORF Transcript_35038/g.93453 Transcript_35038/m.93453 type:complete len:208 (+) Transcript_35038:72-695(+)